MKNFLMVLMAFAFTSVTTSTAQNKKAGDIAKAYYAAIDNSDYAAFEKIASPNFMFSAPFFPTPVNTEIWKMTTQSFKQGFPDVKHEIIDWFADNKKICVKGLFTGTNTGILQGNPPSGKKVSLTFTAIFELDDSWKISTIDVQFDNATFMKQLTPDKN